MNQFQRANLYVILDYLGVCLSAFFKFDRYSISRYSFNNRENITSLSDHIFSFIENISKKSLGTSPLLQVAYSNLIVVAFSFAATRKGFHNPFNLTIRKQIEKVITAIECDILLNKKF